MKSVCHAYLFRIAVDKHKKRKTSVYLHMWQTINQSKNVNKKHVESTKPADPIKIVVTVHMKCVFGKYTIKLKESQTEIQNTRLKYSTL